MFSMFFYPLNNIESGRSNSIQKPDDIHNFSTINFPDKLSGKLLNIRANIDEEYSQKA